VEGQHGAPGPSATLFSRVTVEVEECSQSHGLCWDGTTTQILEQDILFFYLNKFFFLFLF
jgi:hypothetical protein